MKIWIYLLLFLIVSIIYYFSQRNIVKSLISSLITCACIIIGVLGIKFYIQKYKEKVKIGSIITEQEGTILVNVQAVVNKPVYITNQYTGVVEREHINITSLTHGQIKNIISNRISSANINEKLCEFDTSEIEIRKNIALQDLQYIQQRISIQNELVEKGAGTILELKSLKAQEAQYLGKIELYGNMIEKSTYYAPFNCKIKHGDYLKGSYVLTGSNLMTVYNNDIAIISIRVDLKDLVQLQQKCMVSYYEASFEGVVVSIAPVADKMTNVVEVKIAIQDNTLIVGTLVNVSITSESSQQGVYIPDTAIIQEGPTNYVYIVQDGHAVKIPIQIIMRKEGEVVIHGLTNNQVVVISGASKLSNYCPIKI